LNETEGDATGRDAAALWWGEKSERLAVYARREGGAETKGEMGVGREARRQKLHDNFSSIDPEV